jgi:hypothetical protein
MTPDDSDEHDDLDRELAERTADLNAYLAQHGPRMLVNLGELQRRFVNLDADEHDAVPRDVLSAYLALQSDKLTAAIHQLSDPH